jgi:hypothetical protein
MSRDRRAWFSRAAGDTSKAGQCKQHAPRVICPRLRCRKGPLRTVHRVKSSLVANWQGEFRSQSPL